MLTPRQAFAETLEYLTERPEDEPQYVFNVIPDVGRVAALFELATRYNCYVTVLDNEAMISGKAGDLARCYEELSKGISGHRS
jgi:hypothetical protein